MKHINIPPFLTYVRTECLQENQKNGYFIDAVIFALTSSADNFLKFKGLINNEKVCSNIPINAITNSKTSPKRDEEELIVCKCPSDNIQTHTYEYLQNISLCTVVNEDGQSLGEASYLFSIYWSDNDTELHLLELEDGNYIAVSEDLIMWHNAG